MTTSDPVHFNRGFIAYLDQEEGGLKKWAQEGRKFVRDHLREESAGRRILPPERVDPSYRRVIPSRNNDSLVIRKDLEPGSRAVAMTFGATPDATFIGARRVDIPIFTVSSQLSQIFELQLLAYEEPVTSIIEEHTGKDIQEIEDFEFLTFSEASVQATGQIIRGEQALADAVDEGGASGFRGVIQRPDLVRLANLMLESGNRKRMNKVWMSDVDFNNVLTWTTEDTGDDIASKTMVDGYSYDKLLGFLIVRTIKTDLLQSGNIYGYTEPKFLGFWYILNDIKFYIDKIAALIRWQAWEDIGIGFCNISSLVKLELYNGQEAGDDSSDSLPTESDLFQQTNPAAQPGGAYFPQVSLN